MSIKCVRVGIAVLLAVFAGVQSTAGQEPSSVARSSVDTWLALVDGGRYAESWKTAGAFFRNAVTVDKWEEAVRAARGPLGALKSREVKSVTPTKSLPGAPEGDYVVFDFNASFERKAAALERVVTVREADGNWRIVGYFVK